MGDLVIRLKCEISSLQTQLVYARQEKQKLYDTVIFLSSVLSGCAQSGRPMIWNQHGENSTSFDSFTSSPKTNGSTDTQTALSLSHADEIPKHLSGGTQNNVKDTSGLLISSADEAPNLIDLSSPPPETHYAEDNVKIAGAGTQDASSGAILKEISTDSITEESHRSKDKPPVLDLQFKGLRTTHDGPKKTSSVVGSFDPRSSTRAPSFEVIYGQITPVSDINPEADLETASIDRITETGKVTTIADAKSQHPTTRLSPTAPPWLPPRRPALNHESSSLQKSGSVRVPLSLCQGVKYAIRDNEPPNSDRVIVLNLPKDISLSVVLAKIRGGTVISCETLDTGFAYGSPSVMIRFSRSIEAMFCVNKAATTPLIFDGRTAVVQLVPTPSYPLAPKACKDVFENGHTRCLRIPRFSQFKGRGIFRQYANPRYIEYQATNAVGDWFVRFTSLQRASALWADMQSGFNKFGGGFMPDPCAADELLDVETCKKKEHIKAMPMVPLKWKM